MSYELTKGAIQTIMTGGEVVCPVLQILGSKEISSNNPSKRYRILISDGVHLNSYAMLASHLTPMLLSGELVENSVVKITNHVASIVKNADKGDKRIMVILDLEVIMHGAQVGMKIGNPVQFDPNQQSQQPTPMQQAPQAVQSKPSFQQRINEPVTPKSKPAFNGYQNNETIYNSPKTTKTHPIASISPYQNNWTIKVRVTSKSQVRTWSNAKGEGKLFSMDLVDESGEIRATAFKDQVDKYYDMIQEDKLYYISKCQVKMANKKFCTLNNNYELSFTNETQVIPCVEEDTAIPKLQFNFASLSTIQDAEAGSILDFIGVCKSAGDVVTLTARTTNRELKKRDVTIVDRSLTAVTLTLWGNQAEDFRGDTHPVLAVKGGKVSEFGGGKSVSLLASSVLQVNPDIPDAHRLKGWFDDLTEDAKFNSVSSRSESGGGGKWYLIGEAVAAKVGCGEKAEYFSTYATVMHVRQERCVYKACPTPDCQKKVIDQNTGQYKCEKCNREFDSFKYRLMLSVDIGDFSGHQWITIFQEAAEELLGVSADTVGRLQEENTSQFGDIFRNVTLQPFQFKLRAKMETYNDESRLKMSAFSVKKPDINDRCRRLCAEICELSGIESR